MKCPKCGYLGFEHVDRCRNCGYEFSLTPSAVVSELPIRTDTGTLAPLDDLSLLDAVPPLAPQPALGARDLTLFGADDAPLITRPSPPRQPLAVRRATPDVPRLRGDQPRSQTLNLDLEDPPPPLDLPALRPVNWPSGSRPEPPENAALGARFTAVLLDLFILAAVDAAVVYFTMQICGITLAELDVLPKGPLLAFLIVQNVGYLVTFTAGGQTLGKMAAGIKVVSAGSGSPLDLGHAVLRTLVWMILVVPAGLGFLTALFSSDHRGLHDRFARTRVVRATA